MLFISYSRDDVIGAKNLSDALLSKGVEFWLDEYNIPVGQAFVAQLGEALQRSDAFLLVDTPASRRSYWVSREIKTAIRYRREARYHALIRAYSPACEGGIGSLWDDSYPLDSDELVRFTEMLSVRSTPRRDAAVRDASSSVSIESNGLGQPSNWSGRQDELRNLDEWWFGSTRMAWIQGLGGTGKSGLVQTWITALGYLGYDDPVNATVLHMSGREVVETDYAIGRLATWQTNAANDCKLFFLDGYDEAHSGANLEVLLQEALRLGFRAVVTSRSQAPSSFFETFQSIDLASMSRRDSTSMLSEFGIGATEGIEAASVLGDHPLALILFARYVASGKCTASEALRDLRSPRPAELRSTLRASLAASVRALTPDANQLLGDLCAAVDIGIVSLTDFRCQWEPPQPDSLRELARASLVQVDHLETPTTFAIHPLVRNFIREDHRGLLEDANPAA
jgi:hypothetical protein